MKKYLLTGLGFFSLFNYAHAENTTGNFEANAKIEKFCQMSAEDVNFGMVNLPLSMQGTKSNMKVHCSKGTAYTVNLNYGGVYGQGGGNDGVQYTFVKNSGFPGVQIWYAYANGSYIGDFNCYSNGEIYVRSSFVAEKIGIATFTTYYDNGNYGVCSGISVNSSSLSTKLGARAAYNYGVMNGSTKGDKLAYAITVPNDSTKVWNNGINTYSNVGDGFEQEIDINAKIIPEKSSSLYLAQDSYFDIVTANITY